MIRDPVAELPADRHASSHTDSSTSSYSGSMSVPGGIMGDVRIETARTPFIGREHELAQLRDVFKDARSGEPAAVLISGEAGIGKTRLVDELATEAESAGARVIRGHSVALDGEELAFAPITGMVRGLAADFGTERLVELAGPSGNALTALLPEIGGVAGEATGQGRLYEVITSLLERLAADQPLVVIVEDLQWADGATRDMLRFVVRSLIAVPVLLLMTYRDDEIGRGHPLRQFVAELDRHRRVVRLAVTRFERAHVADQLRAITGQDAEAGQIERVLERSEGVPFYVEELAFVDDHSGHQMPASLRDVLLARVEPLTERTQKLLRLMSVASSHVGHELVEAVADEDVPALERSLREAVSAGVLVVDGRGYGFRHALMREALHADLLPGEHARMHACYARTLEEQPELAPDSRADTEIAHHWYFAHDVGQAFRWSLRSAEELDRANATGGAQTMIERALELWDQVDDPASIAGTGRPELMVRASMQAYEAGEDDRAVALARAAVESCDERSDPVRAGETLGWLGRLSCKLNLPGSIELLTRARALVQSGAEPLTRATIVEWLSNNLALEWRYGDALDAVDEAERLGHVVGADHLIASARTTRATIWMDQGRKDESLAEFERARPLVAVSADTLLRFHVNLAHALGGIGEYRRAVEVAQEGKERAVVIGRGRTHGSMLAGNAAAALVQLGEWDRAEGLITRALELLPPSKNVRYLDTLRAWLSLWRGDIAAAEHAAAGLHRAVDQQAAFPQYRCHIAQLRGELAWAKGEYDAAWSHVMSVFDDARSTITAALPLLTVAASVLGAQRRSGAIAEVEEPAAWVRATTAAMSDGSPMPEWRALVDAELAGDDPDAWRAALTALEAAEGPTYLRTYARYQLGSALVTAGARDEARDALRTAASEAETLGSGLLAGWITEVGSRAGLSTTERVTPSLSTTYGLTGREREVLRLIAAGRSNREIGAGLYISAKTASVHVSNILTKLGVSGRGEAAALAHRHGLVD
ncbi:helix-turn-helix transcriptional regulator [Actinobacteria bacterium YIM 96077]|uniref:HTH luxR-type domain-containing protein n=1 Tax=Phytoactinopolyspora halophila TaxID=1981511 RepID=A0A329QRX7_9ACTN|nr:helix-turn-helix transcriptional regulator [Phytoactinopolyspora halophila]AYY14229.1 helix-turn-helix transcriptional regulator [Actinobacteria bacterium YIM 96077]RAW14771.1 hypothetical protein DPM12_09755 [Phytoactinopolyspora halophila]